MIRNQKKAYQEQLKLTRWFAIITLICAGLIAAAFYWLHAVWLLAIGIMFGPIFAVLTVIFGLLALGNRISMRK
ncbi:MAG: hypothetical protein RLZZ06_381 [Actinomycetota bacterium]|jgi:hypothetical protein